MARKAHDDDGPIIIKKYANRRLYNTASSSYVTLDNLAEMVRAGQEFIVKDAKSGEDLTRGVLAQIIMDKETKDNSLLPLPFLRQLISLYGDNLQTMVPGYLQSTLDTLKKHQGDLQKAMTGGSNASAFMPIVEEMTRQNMAFFEESMRLFREGATTAAGQKTNESKKDQEIDELKAQLKALQEKVNALG